MYKRIEGEHKRPKRFHLYEHKLICQKTLPENRKVTIAPGRLCLEDQMHGSNILLVSTKIERNNFQVEKSRSAEAQATDKPFGANSSRNEIPPGWLREVIGGHSDDLVVHRHQPFLLRPCTRVLLGVPCSSTALRAAARHHGVKGHSTRWAWSHNRADAEAEQLSILLMDIFGSHRPFSATKGAGVTSSLLARRSRYILHVFPVHRSNHG